MKHILAFVLVMPLAVPLMVHAAEPLAQEYVVVHKVRDLDQPAKAVDVLP